MYRFIVKGLSKNIYINKKINNQIDDIEFSFKTEENELNFHSSSKSLSYDDLENKSLNILNDILKINLENILK